MYQLVSPKKVDKQTKLAIEQLELTEASTQLLKLYSQVDFDAEMHCCHLNVWVQCLQKGGSAQHGWIIYQDKSKAILVAVFHTVWKAPDGSVLDITPREFGDKRVLFVMDDKRSITLKKMQGMLVVDSFENLQIMGNAVIQQPVAKLISPQTDMITKYGLDSHW